jgi:hypothetical protein
MEKVLFDKEYTELQPLYIYNYTANQLKKFDKIKYKHYFEIITQYPHSGIHGQTMPPTNKIIYTDKYFIRTQRYNDQYNPNDIFRVQEFFEHKLTMDQLFVIKYGQISMGDGTTQINFLLEHPEYTRSEYRKHNLEKHNLIEKHKRELKFNKEISAILMKRLTEKHKREMLKLKFDKEISAILMKRLTEKHKRDKHKRD